MKRIRTSLTAAVVSGALVFGVVPAAQAEDKNEDAVATATVSREENDKVADELGLREPTAEELENADTPADTHETDTREPAPAAGDTSRLVHAIPGGNLEAELKNDEDNAVTPDSLAADKDAVDVSSETATATLPKGSGLGAIAGAALAALTIGGITYYLMNDGKTFTPDKSRAGQTPTAEEVAKSEQVLADNANEVNQQINDAKGSRGMAADTGSNTAARGLAALAVAAMIGAAAFVARRRFFA